MSPGALLWVSIGFFAFGLLTLGMAVVVLLHITDLIAGLMRDTTEMKRILGSVIATVRGLSQWRN